MVFEVTAASLSPNQQQLVLLGANRVWLFQNFTGSNFFGGSLQTLNLSTITQKEAIEFVDNYRVYIGNEDSFLGGPQLNELSLSNWVQVTSIGLVPMPLLMPNPTQEQVRMQLTLAQATTIQASLYHLDGRCAQQWAPEHWTAGAQERLYHLPTLTAGLYYWRVKIGDQWLIQRLVID